MIRVMEKLRIPIPPFVLHRRLIVELQTINDGQHKLVIRGVDIDDTPVTFLRFVKLVNNRRVARTEPFELAIRDEVTPGTEFTLELGFMGHYGEPDLEFVYKVPEVSESSKILYLLQYHPSTGVWETNRQDGRV